MSLTSILSCPTHQQLRDKLKTEFPKPAIERNKPIKVPPHTNNYGIVGTAFDYLARFHLESLNEGAKINKSNWVCTIALNRLLRKLQKIEQDVFIYKRTKEGISECTLKDFTAQSMAFYRSIGYTIIEKNRFIESLQYDFLEAQRTYQQYLITRRLTHKLIKSALFFAKLDIYLRAGIFDFDTFNQYNEADLDDLKKLFTLLRRQNLTYCKHCYLNPTFGSGSLMVGGADADLIIDDTLIEIKVTKNLELERSQFNQLIGYYFLSQIGGVNNYTRARPIKHIGIYFARHGYLWKMPVSQLGSYKKRKEFKNWMIEYFVEQRKAGLADFELQLSQLKSAMKQINTDK